MPTDFDMREYWHRRFSTESAFEWLVPSEVFMSILEPYLENLKCSSKILQLGLGTSDLHNHIRAHGFSEVLNVDYEPLAVERGRQLEGQAFGDVRMRYLVADATKLPAGLGEGEGEGEGEAFELVVDKSTADAVSCGGDGALLRMARGVERCLSTAGGGGCWVSLSYSPRRFDVPGLPLDVEVIARLPTPKRRETDPDVFYYCYLLRPRSEASS